MTDKNHIIEAFTEMAPRYEQVVDSELNRFWGWSYEGFVNKLFEKTPVSKKDTILDVATGTGTILHRLERLGLDRNRIHGLDITLSMLRHARRRLGGNGVQEIFNLVCASAMEMPYANASFTQVMCGLATHHMHVRKMLFESHRVLRRGGILSIIDAGGAFFWKFPGVKFLLKLAAWIYFALVENRSRAWAEASAVSNVYSREEWNALLAEIGFQTITISRLKSKFLWVPAPLLIRAKKKEAEDE
jgi:ubiquinone/menaquinone biosynthesis C-methylase UbiE